jgi:NAD(P)-dependent dehydrogenase (short-subunit alcohol dehydrogenase family)
MPGRLQGKKALITGGDSGIGRAVAIAFAREGADVAIVFQSDVRAALETRGQVEQHDRRCVLLQGDVGKESDVARLVPEAVKALGGLEVLVNNAGVEQRGKWEEFSLEDWDRILRSNLTGAFLMVREVLRREVLEKGARIINTGSIQGFEGSATDPAYSVTKGGIHALTKSLAKYLVDRGIHVNCVAPGPVDTPMLRDQTPQLKEGSEKYPLGVASPEAIAPCYVFLASDDAKFMTGMVLAPTSGKVTAW